MKQLAQALRKALERKFGYRMYLQGGDWDGISHYSFSYAEALEWMQCYPGNIQKFVFSWRGKCLAMQWQYIPEQPHSY